MKNSFLLNGLIRGIEMMGGKFVKLSETHIYFDIPNGCEIDDVEKLKRANFTFKDQPGIGMKIRKVEK